MTLERFIGSREGDWRRLEQLVEEAKGRAERLGPEGVLELGSLYRGAAADLALARSRFPAEPVRRRLESLVRSAGLLVYEGSKRRRPVRGFVTDLYWRRIAERPGMLAIAAAITFLPALVAALWAGGDPTTAIGFLPEDFRGAADPPADDGSTTGESTAFAAFLFTHNIQVSFLAFAAGITAGIGTGIVMLFNGLILGTVAGLAIEAGNGAAFFDFIIPHGPIELSAFLVVDAAGLRIGWALVDPGNASRRDSLASEARRAVDLVLGTMPWLVVAGFAEAFVRGSGLPTAVLATVGLGLFGVFWGLVVWRGHLVPRREAREEAGTGVAAPAPPTSRAAPAPSL